MEEIKSVKVDNWGVFFLQKLQNFFNKTDYCDLTLQFNDNSQLKVHRLVLSACTDYFNVLEQTCEMIDDVLIMPPELQADVVVPIVNFMYTGTLEFELKMYGKLLKTARDMNMTVLSKLLEAHRRTMEGTRQQAQTRTSPKQFRRGGGVNIPSINRLNVGPGRPRVTTPVSLTPQRGRPPQNAIQYKSVQIRPVNSGFSKTSSTSTPTQIIMSKSQGAKHIQIKGPSRYEESLPEEGFESTFESLSYESKPLMCKEEPDSYEYETVVRRQETHTSSPFEQLRRGYTNSNNKRAASSMSSYESPPEKKPNIQDVKEYAEQQRMRKQIAQEFDDDNEYEETLDDEFQNDDDDDEYVPPASLRRQVKKESPQSQPKKSGSSGQSYKKQDDSQRPTIVVKDSTSSNVNHAKIISEVLRKYPHLVKNNKNIKLKIMQQSGGSQNAQKIIVKEETESDTIPRSTMKTYSGSTSVKQEPVSIIKKSPPATTSTSASQSQSQPPRRIDSKTMHALIALGAENRNGPWLCLRCGVSGRPISIPSYRGFRRHLINVHKEKIDPRLCEHCGWRSTNNKELYHHMLAEHSIKPPQNYAFPSCSHCNLILLDSNTLQKHINENHMETRKGNQECIYCNETFAASMELYNHMKSQHRERAREDGVLDFSDDEMDFEESDGEVQSQSESEQNKIQILSDISLPKNAVIRGNAKSGEKVELNSLGTGIAASLGLLEGSEIEEARSLSPTDDQSSKEPKFVNVDGSEMELTPAQRQEIIKQLGQEHDGLVMVLNDDDLTEESRAGSALKDQTDESMQSAESANEDEEISESSLPARKSKKIIESVKSIKNKSANVDLKKKTDRKSIEEPEDEEEEEEEDEDEEEEDEDDKRKTSKTTKKTKSKSSSPVDSMEIKKKILTDWEVDESDKDSHKEEEITKSSDKNKKENKTTPKYESDKDEMLFEAITTADEDSQNSQNNDNKDEEKDKDESTEDEVEKELKKLENAEKEEVSETEDKTESKDNASKTKIESNIKVEEEEEEEPDEVVEEIKEKENNENSEDSALEKEKIILDKELKKELEEDDLKEKKEPVKDISKDDISDSEHSNEKTKTEDDKEIKKNDDVEKKETDTKVVAKDEDLKKSDHEDLEENDKKRKSEGNGEATGNKSKKKPEEDILFTKADIKNLIDDWGEDDDI